MRKVIAVMNVTLDGFCDHTAMIADDEIHTHYNELFADGDTLIYGRTTYQLMQSYWPTVVENPSGNKPIDEFAVLIDNISKVVFSHTLLPSDLILTWKNTTLAKGELKEEVLTLKQQEGKDIFVGSPSLIASLLDLDLIDECQFSIHPTIVGKGLTLFQNIGHRIDLKLLKTKIFACGVVTFYYQPLKNK